MSVKISELPILSSLADNDVIAGVDTSANVTSKIEMVTLKNYIDTNTQYTAGTNIDITNNVVSAPNVYNKTETDGLIDNLEANINEQLEEKDEQIEELQSEVDSLSTIFNAFPTESGEGESLTLDDTAEVKFKKFDLKGNTSQTTYSGKNMFSTSMLPVTEYGITISKNANGDIVLNGTPNFSEGYRTFYTGDVITVEAGTYTLSVANKVTGIGCVVGGFNGGCNLTLSDSVTSKTAYADTPQNVNPAINIRYDVGTLTNFVLNPMMEKSSSATTYEQFVGGTASPNPSYPQPVNVVSGDNEISVCGKNLIGLGTILHAYRDNSTGKIQLNDNCVGYYFPTSVLPDTITFSCVGGNRANISYYNSVPASTVESVDYSNSNSLPRTISVNKTYAYIFIQFSYNTLDVTNIQLEKGSTASIYEPYIGNSYHITLPSGMELCKIGNYQDYFGKSDGRNLFDKDNLTIEIGTISATGTFDYSTERLRAYYIEVDENTTYTVSTSNSDLQIVPYFYNSNKTFLSFDNGWKNFPYTFTTPSNTKYIALLFKNSNNTPSVGMIGNLQLEKGSSVSDYQPYGVGKWYLHKEIGKVVLNGSESWFAEAQRYKLDNIIQGKTFSTLDENNPLAYCNGFKWGNGTSSNFVYGAFWYTANGLNLSMQKDENPNTTTLANFKTWLESNNQKVYYVLATPTITQITYQPLIDQLNAIEKAMSKDGQTNISQVNNDKPFILDVTAIKSLQNVLDRIELLES